MSQINILIIKENNFVFLKDKYYNLKNKLAEDIKEYVEIKNIMVDDLMGTIIEEIHLTTDLVGDSMWCYETADNIYQLCYVINEKNDQSCPNHIGSYLIGENTSGTCVLINSKITNNYTCASENVTFDNLVDILYGKFVHKGIYIPSDDNQKMVEFEFLNHPLEYYNLDHDQYDNYKGHEITFLKFNLSMFIEKKSEKNINKRATKVCGTGKINGDAILINKTSQEFIDLDKTMFNKIFKLSSGWVNNRNLKEGEFPEEEKIDGLPVVVNKYIILEKKFLGWQNECHYCEGVLNDKSFYVCTGCYRMRYDTPECQKNGWENHKSECLFNKNPIN